jgi:hypothetical protein
VYKNSQIGDPVTVTGTEKRLARDNGWTVWDMSWADYVKGSALPQQSGSAPPQQSGGAQPQQADRGPAKK